VVIDAHSRRLRFYFTNCVRCATRGDEFCYCARRAHSTPQFVSVMRPRPLGMRWGRE
jgi:hypothetical protein